MKRSIPYSFLLLTAFILNRIVITSGQISPTESVRPFVVMVLLLSLAFFGIRLFVKEWHRTNFLVALIPVSLLVYSAVYRWIKVTFVEDANAFGLLLIPYTVLLYAMLAQRRWWQRIPEPARVTYYLNLVFVLLMTMQTVEVGLSFQYISLVKSKAQMTAISSLSEPIILHPAAKPDIYILILDGYARQDVLKEIYSYDNSEFIGQLQKRGFYVAADSHSNYIQTAYAIASIMNFDYIQPWKESTDYIEYLLDPIQHNRVFQMLKGIGYTTVSFEGGTSYTRIANSDILDAGFIPLNRFETMLLTDSPVEPLTNTFHLGISIPSYETHRTRILNHLDNLQKIPETVPGPKVTYFHILVPHPPFVLDENGNALNPRRPYSILDGDEYPGSLDEYWSGYRQQVQFVNGKILEDIDVILAKSKTPPVILLMSDHGPGSMFKWDPQHPGCTWERTHNFYALYLPNPQVKPILYPGMTPVNTFRVVFNSYFGTNLPLLDDRTYLATWQYPNTIVDATGIRDSTAACSLQNQ